MTSALRGVHVPSKADIVSNLSKGVCVNLRTRVGVKKSEDVVYGSPTLEYHELDHTTLYKIT